MNARFPKFLRQISLLLPLPLFAANSATVKFDLNNFTLSNVTNRTVLIAPMTAPFSQGGRIIGNDTSRYTATNGVFYVSNMTASATGKLYWAQLQAPPRTTDFYILVTNSTDVLNAGDLLVETPADLSVTYSKAQIDAMFATNTSSGGTSGALTNYETRDVFLTGDLNITNVASQTIRIRDTAGNGQRIDFEDTDGSTNGIVSSGDEVSIAHGFLGAQENSFTFNSGGAQNVSHLPLVGNGSGLTNLPAYATNYSVLRTQTVENAYSVNSAGISAANGLYRKNTSVAGPNLVFTNSAGTYGIFYNDTAETAILTNNSGVTLYSQAAGVITGTWTVDSGTAPAPVIVGGTNIYAITNYDVAELVGAFRVFEPDSTAYVSVSGNDSTARLGRPDLAYRSLDAAYTNVNFVSGLTIAIGPGTFDFTNTIYFSNAMAVIGAGKYSTILRTPLNVQFQFGSDSVAANLTLLSLTTNGSTYTTPLFFPTGIRNARVSNVRVFGSTDGVYNSGDQENTAWIDNSDMITEWDAYAGAGIGLTSFNCRYISNYRSNIWANYNGNRAVVGNGPGTNTFINCYIEVNGGYSNACLEVAGASSTFSLINCSFNSTATNANSWHIKNSGGGTPLLRSTFPDPSKISGAVTYMPRIFSGTFTGTAMTNTALASAVVGTDANGKLQALTSGTTVLSTNPAAANGLNLTVNATTGSLTGTNPAAAGNGFTLGPTNFTTTGAVFSRSITNGPGINATGGATVAMSTNNNSALLVSRSSDGAVVFTVDAGANSTTIGTANASNFKNSAGDAGFNMASGVIKMNLGTSLQVPLIYSTNGYVLPTNAISAWPTVPRWHGEAFIGNSNGVVYLLTSVPGSLTWAATNKLAP